MRVAGFRRSLCACAGQGIAFANPPQSRASVPPNLLPQPPLERTDRKPLRDLHMRGVAGLIRGGDKRMIGIVRGVVTQSARVSLRHAKE